MYWWFQAVSGLLMALVGWVVASGRTLPGPAWVWGVDVDASSPARRLSGRASIVMGAGFVAMAWFGDGTPRGAAWIAAVAFVFLGWSAALTLRAERLRKGFR
jgi:hypothetical protein